MPTHFAPLPGQAAPAPPAKAKAAPTHLQTALLVDESGYLSNHSRDVLKFLGYSPGLVPPRLNLLSHVAHWDRYRASRDMAQSMTSGREHRAVYTFILADGSSFAASMVCAPCHCSGRPAGLKVSLSRC
ncbi:MAG: hypothetical protein KQH53_01840 [Desulfarculaceae bacterium]|nr:hypothetical protein [Desulfarculaceae bacterium]